MYSILIDLIKNSDRKLKFFKNLCKGGLLS